MEARILTVEFPVRLRRGFRRVAYAGFPRESYAILLGKRTKLGCAVKELYYPTLAKCDANTRRVTIRSTWWETAARYGGMNGWEVLGDLHSHCYSAVYRVAGAYPSQSDWDSLDENYWQGILSITRFKDGHAHSYYRFWPSLPKVELIG